MTTSQQGNKTFCDACTEGHFWNTLEWDRTGLWRNKTTQGCIECCVRCEDACFLDDEDSCLRCDQDDIDLEFLDVKEGWWRATPEAMKVYRCPLDGSCRGGNSTVESKQCESGYIGAVCGACDKNFDSELGGERCSKCASVQKMAKRAGNLALSLVFGAAFLYLLCSWLYSRAVSGGADGTSASGAADATSATVSARHANNHNWWTLWWRRSCCSVSGCDNEAPTAGRRGTVFPFCSWRLSALDKRIIQFFKALCFNKQRDAKVAVQEHLVGENNLIPKSIWTKIKIVVAAWQIAAAAEEVAVRRLASS